MPQYDFLIQIASVLQRHQDIQFVQCFNHLDQLIDQLGHKKGHRTKLAFVDPRNWLSQQGGSELKILIEHQ